MFDDQSIVGWPLELSDEKRSDRPWTRTTAASSFVVLVRLDGFVVYLLQVDCVEDGVCRMCRSILSNRERTLVEVH